MTKPRLLISTTDIPSHLTNCVQCTTSPGWHPSRAAFHFPESDAMSDIVERLRKWFKDVNAVSAIDLMDEAANEIERLRNGAAEARETVCPHVRGTVTQHCSLNFTLTDEERAAVETAMDGYIAWMDDNVALETPRVQAKLATLRKLLERTK